MPASHTVRRVRRALAPALTAAVVLACLWPGERLPAAARHVPDLALHAAGFYALTLCWFLAGLRAPSVLLVTLAVAAGTEAGQALLPWGRHGDAADLGADVLGTLAAWLPMILPRWLAMLRRGGAGDAAPAAPPEEP